MKRASRGWSTGVSICLSFMLCVGLVLSLSACPTLAASLVEPRLSQRTPAISPLRSMSRPSSRAQSSSQPQTRKPAPAPRTSSRPATPAPPAKPVAVAPAPPSAAETAALTTVVETYFAALNARDAEAALRLWSAQSPELGTQRQGLPLVLERTAPTWTDVQATVLSVERGTARARVVFNVSYRRAGTGPTTPILTRNVMVFVREAGEWRITAEKPESQDLAERLLAAPTEEAAARIIGEDRTIVGLAVIRALIGLAGAAAARSDFTTAITGFTRAAQLAETPVAPLADHEQRFRMAETHLAMALGGLAQVYVYKPQPDLPRAIALLSRALTLHEETSNEAGVSDSLQALGNAYYSFGDYAEALDRYQRVLPIAAKQQDRESTARTQLGIGNVQYLFGQYDLARAAYGAALDVYAGNPEEEPRARQGLGRVLAATGDFDGARMQFERALAVLALATRPQPSEQASVLIEIGKVAFQQGQFAEARSRYDLAVAVAEKGGDRFTQGRALFSLGLLQAVEADFEGAIERYTRAAEAFQRATPPNLDAVGQAILARASARVEQRNLPRALEDFTASLQAFEKAPNREGMARAHLGLAMVHGRRQQAKPALDAATRALDLAERAAAPDVLWQARHEAGRAWLLAGDQVKARQAFEEAIRVLEETRFEAGAEAEAQAPSQRAAPYVSLVEWHVARAEQARARRGSPSPAVPQAGVPGGGVNETGAKETGAKAAGVTATGAEATGSDEAGAKPRGMKASGAEETGSGEGGARPPGMKATGAGAIEAGSDEAARALIAAEAGKRRLLEDLMRPFHFRLTRGLSPERQAEERRLVNQRVSLLRQLRRERDLKTPNATRIATLEQALVAGRASTMAWNRVTASELPALVYQRGAATLASLDPLAAALPQDAALVHFVVGDDRTSVIVATHPRPVSASRPPTTSPVSAPSPLANPASAPREGAVEEKPTGAGSERAVEADSTAASRASAPPSSSSAASSSAEGAVGEKRTGAGSERAVEADSTAASRASAQPSSSSGASSSADGAAGEKRTGAASERAVGVNSGALSAPSPASVTASGSQRDAAGDGATATVQGVGPAGDGDRGVEIVAFTVAVTRQQLAERVWHFADVIAQRGDTATVEARALYDLLLAPAAERLAGRSTLVIVPDDSLWTLPFEALMPSDDRYLIQDATITAIPSVATWVLRPAARPAASASPTTSVSTAADRAMFAALTVSGEFSDISPLQTHLTFAAADVPPLRPDSTPATATSSSSADAPAADSSSAGASAAGTPSTKPASPSTGSPTQVASATLAAWELLDRDLPADELLLADVRPKAERLRLDAGRLGATGLFWALQAAGARRIILARRPLPADAPVATALPLPHPHEWATWLVIGPPREPAAQTPAQPGSEAAVP